MGSLDDKYDISRIQKPGNEMTECEVTSKRPLLSLFKNAYVSSPTNSYLSDDYVDEDIDEELRQADMMADDNHRLFVDMDGTIAEFQVINQLEKLYEKGYFMNLKPIDNVLDAIKTIIHENPEIEVYIISSVLSDSKYALEEKNKWLDKYLPEIDSTHRIFPPCGEDKKNYVMGGVRKTDFLLDDYTKNLTLWQPPAKAIKLLNGINHTVGTWKGNRVSFEKSPQRLASDISLIINQDLHIYDKRPIQQKQEKSAVTVNKYMEKSNNKTR